MSPPRLPVYSPGCNEEVPVIVMGAPLPTALRPKLSGFVPRDVGNGQPQKHTPEVLLQLSELACGTEVQQSSLDFVGHNGTQVDRFAPLERPALPVHHRGDPPQELCQDVRVQQVGHR